MREHKFYFLFSLLFGDVIVILQQKSNTMFAIFINIAAIIGGSIIGGLTKRKVNEQYLNALSTGMGIAVLVLGIYLAIQDMQKSTTPVLFIMCLAFGGVIGSFLKLDARMEHYSKKVGKATPKNMGSANLADGITTAVLLCCVGTLAMVGPIRSAIYGDDTYLMTAATLNFVTCIVLSSSYGVGISLTSVPVFIWMSSFFLIGKLSAGLVTGAHSEITAKIMTETNIVGGVLIAAAGLGILHIKDCKTVNLLPALFLPLIYFLIVNLFT